VRSPSRAKRGDAKLDVDGRVSDRSRQAALVDGRGQRLSVRWVGHEPAEVEEVIGLGGLNALFVLGRSIGIMGHVMDQKRMRTRLCRQPWEEILFMMPDSPEEAKQA